MIRVTLYARGGAFTHVDHEFMDDVAVKVLQSGALKLVIPATFETPPMGSKDEPIVIQPERVLAVFNGDYIMERV